MQNHVESEESERIQLKNDEKNIRNLFEKITNEVKKTWFIIQLRMDHNTW